jgi:hypothetical protein
MRHLLLAYAAFAVSSALAQEINQPRMIGDPKLAACIDRLGQKIVHDGIAKVPFAIEIDVSGAAVSTQQAQIVSDPPTAACIDLVAQNLLRNGSAKLPFAIRVTPER